MPGRHPPDSIADDGEFETLASLLHAYRTPVVIILFGILIALGLFFATLVGQTRGKESAFRNHANARLVELDASFDILFAELNQLDAIIGAGLTPETALTSLRRSGTVTHMDSIVDIGVIGPDGNPIIRTEYAATIATALLSHRHDEDAVPNGSARIHIFPIDTNSGNGLIFAAARPVDNVDGHYAFIVSELDAMLSPSLLPGNAERLVIRFGEAEPVFSDGSSVASARRVTAEGLLVTSPYLVRWAAPAPFEALEVNFLPTRAFLLEFGVLPWLVLAFTFFATAAIGALALKDARRSELVRREVDRKTAELKASNAVIAAKNEELARFAAHASHDLQAPLRAMKSLATLLVERDLQLDERSEDMLNRINRGADRAQKLVQDLLSYTQAEKAQLAPEPVTLDEIREEIEDLLGETAREADAEIVWQGAAPIHADRFLLCRAVQNLVSNAIKYRGERTPRIVVETRVVGSATRLSVTDNGIGIEEAYFDKIFDIFERLHTPDTYSGSGIGLALCKRVADMHDAQIGLTSEPGEGSCFYIIFPNATARAQIGRIRDRNTA